MQKSEGQGPEHQELKDRLYVAGKAATLVTQIVQRKIPRDRKFPERSGDTNWRGRELSPGGGARRRPVLCRGSNRRIWRWRLAHDLLGQRKNVATAGKGVYRFVLVCLKFLKKVKAPGEPRGLCGSLGRFMSLKEVNACIRIIFRWS